MLYKKVRIYNVIRTLFSCGLNANIHWFQILLRY